MNKQTKLVKGQKIEQEGKCKNIQPAPMSNSAWCDSNQKRISLSCLICVQTQKVDTKNKTFLLLDNTSLKVLGLKKTENF